MRRREKTYSTGELIKDALIISVAVIVVRIVWVFPAAYLPRLFSKNIRAHDPYPSWRHVAVVAWTGMRGGGHRLCRGAGAAVHNEQRLPVSGP